MRLLLGALGIAVLLLTQPLTAGPIQYVESGNLSGALGGATLTNASFVFIFNGDTLNITGGGGSAFQNSAISNTITIGGSNGSFTSAVGVGVNDAQGIIGFSGVGLNGVTFFIGGVTSYNLATAIGPLAESAPGFISGSFTTSLGPLAITGATNLTFQATLLTSTPEPLTFGLSALGVLGMALVALGRRGAAYLAALQDLRP